MVRCRRIYRFSGDLAGRSLRRGAASVLGRKFRHQGHQFQGAEGVASPDDRFGLAGQVAGQVCNDVARVVFGAVDEGGLATPEHGEADRVQARCVDYPAIMA